MALYDTADLLRRCKVKLNRPATDEAFTVTTTDDVWYDLLSEAQQHVHAVLVSTCPDAMYSSLTALTTADGGLTYSFGSDDDDDSLFPYGQYELYFDSLSYPGNPLIEGVDFIAEGTKIRGPNGLTLQTPYARFITPPHKIDASTEPTLLPKFARILIVDRALITACEQRLKQDSSAYRSEYGENMKRVLLSMKTQVFGQGGSARLNRTVGDWYKGNPDLG